VLKASGVRGTKSRLSRDYSTTGGSGVGAVSGASQGKSELAAETLCAETEAGPKGQAGTEVPLLYVVWRITG